MQPVRQLNQNNPQVFRHCHKQLAKIFGLLGLVRIQLQVGQLGHAINQLGHVTPELFIDAAVGRFRVLDRVVQQCGNDSRVIQMLFGQNSRNRDRMREIGLA